MKMFIGFLFLVAFGLVIFLNIRNKNVPIREESFVAQSAVHVDAHTKTFPVFGPGGRGAPPTKNFHAKPPKKIEEHYLVPLEIDGKIREVTIPAEHLDALQTGILELRFKLYRNGQVEVLEVLN